MLSLVAARIPFYLTHSLSFFRRPLRVHKNKEQQQQLGISSCLSKQRGEQHPAAHVNSRGRRRSSRGGHPRSRIVVAQQRQQQRRQHPTLRHATGQLGTVALRDARSYPYVGGALGPECKCKLAEREATHRITTLPTKFLAL